MIAAWCAVTKWGLLSFGAVVSFLAAYLLRV
jgi:hypothetical protein